MVEQAVTYGWKRLADGQIVQGHSARSADDLFEAAGFGAVDTDKPLNGYLAVRVQEMDGVMVEVRVVKVRETSVEFVIQSSLPSDDELAAKRALMDQHIPGWREMRHKNGALMFAPTGTMLDDKGNRSIFDDVDD